MSKFKSIDYSKFKDDDFIIKSKELLELQKSKASGSYLRYGKEKSCDLDLSEELDIESDKIIDVLKNYFTKLIKRKKEFILTRLTFDIIDESIKILLDKLGNLNGLLQIENSKISEDDINNNLPKKRINKIKKLIKEYNEDKTILTYVNLYMYLKTHIQPTFTIKKALKSKKLANYNFTYMYIEVIFNNYRISNFIYFKKQNKPETKLWNVELNEVLIETLIKTNKNKYQISYYKLLKYFFHFIKKAYFNKIFEEKYLINNTIDTYNEIYDFREKIGDMNNNLCKIENMLIIDNKNIKLQDEYVIVKKEFELKCRNYFLQVSKPYFKYLREYFKLI